MTPEACDTCIIYRCVTTPEGGRKQIIKNSKNADPTAPTETRQPIEGCWYRQKVLYIAKKNRQVVPTLEEVSRNHAKVQ